MQSAAFDELGIMAEYLPIEAPEEEFDACLDHLQTCGFTGVNVTVPHKRHPALQGCGDYVVREIGAANTVRFGAGFAGAEAINTDPLGFMEPLAAMDVGRALILGSGGAASAAVYGLRNAGWEVALHSRSKSNAQEILDKWEVAWSDLPDPSGCSLVVNATPIGLSAGEEPDLEWASLEDGATVFDLAYRKGPTDFLAHALLEGARVIDGREMLVEQGAASFEWWTGRSAPRGVMRKAVGL
jgi:shikimate dehydrogenase